MKRILTLLISISLFLGLVGAPKASTGFKVIVNPRTEVTSLSAKEVSGLFLKKVKSWDNDLRVVPVDLPGNSEARADFSKAVHNKTTAAVKAFWQQRIFSGRDVPPAELSDDADVVAFVRDNPGAIGYVSANADVRGVRVVDVR